MEPKINFLFLLIFHLIIFLFCLKNQVLHRTMSTHSIFLQVLSASVKATDRAGQLVRDIMKNEDLGIVQKTGEKDLQTLADRTANDCIVGSLKKVLSKCQMNLKTYFFVYNIKVL